MRRQRLASDPPVSPQRGRAGAWLQEQNGRTGKQMLPNFLEFALKELVEPDGRVVITRGIAHMQPVMTQYATV